MKFVAAVLLATVAVANAKCLSGEKSKKQSNTECAWYNDDSCCDKDTSKEVIKSVDKLIEDTDKECEDDKLTVSQNCQDLFKLSACAAACSPNYSDYIKKDKFQICKGFADKFWNECKDGAYINEKGKCEALSKQYKDQAAYEKEQKGSEVVEGTEDCFNSAATFAPMVLGVVAAVAVALF